MLLIILLPYISKAYTFERMFQQCLIFLSISSFIFFKKIINHKKELFIISITFIYIFYTLFSLGFFLQTYGGNPTLNLYNFGFTYNALYPHHEEIISINWFNEEGTNNLVYLDPYSQLKFYSFGDPIRDKVTKIIPSLIIKTSYVYSNFANKINEINYWDARERFNNGVLSLNFPTEFLNNNKNKIYNNGGSEIFR